MLIVLGGLNAKTLQFSLVKITYVLLVCSGGFQTKSYLKEHLLINQSYCNLANMKPYMLVHLLFVFVSTVLSFIHSVQVPLVYHKHPGDFWVKADFTSTSDTGKKLILVEWAKHDVGGEPCTELSGGFWS